MTLATILLAAVLSGPPVPPGTFVRPAAMPFGPPTPVITDIVISWRYCHPAIFTVSTSPDLMHWADVCNTNTPPVELLFTNQTPKYFLVEAADYTNSLTVAWSPSTDPRVSGYALNWGTATNAMTNLVQTTGDSVTFTDLHSQPLYFQVSSVAAGANSPPCAPMEFTPPMQFTGTTNFVKAVLTLK